MSSCEKGDWNESVLKERSKFPKGVMFFGCISVGFKSTFVQCTKNVDATEYLCNVQKSLTIQKLNEMHGEKRWVFMQDGAPCHNASISKSSLGMNLIILPGWPPNSPDLNSIEMIWSIIKRSLQTQPVQQENLGAKVREIWESIPQEVIDKLCLSFKKRLELCLKIGGKSISQYLSSHRLEAKPEDIVELDQIKMFTEDEDKWILVQVSKFGKKWKRMSQEPIMEGRNWTEIKNRYHFLIDWEKMEKELSRVILPHIDNLLSVTEGAFDWTEQFDSDQNTLLVKETISTIDEQERLNLTLLDGM